jgi:splicing factor 45
VQPPQPPQLPQPPSATSEVAATAEGDAAASTTTQAPQQPKTTIADWTAEGDEDEYYFGAQQRQRGGRKRRKKNKEQAPVAQDWDDIYDPSRPNNYEEYKHSDERIRELREWKDRLYAHRITRRGSEDSDSEEDRRPTSKSWLYCGIYALVA